MENELTVLNSENIKSLIYTVRGKQVMLDSDVAELFEYKTKVLNLTVKRNIERFPKEFCFQLTEKEVENLRFQFETSNENRLRGGRRYLPCIYRTGNRNASWGIKERNSSKSKYRYN